MKVLVLTRYTRRGASSRIRMLQFVPGLNESGIDVEVSALLGADYLDDLYARRGRRVVPIIIAYIRRLRRLLSGRYDVIWLEKELFPWLPAIADQLIRLTGIPYVVDYDDATFHDYDLSRSRTVRWLLGKKISRVIHHAAAVTVGNGYLAEYAIRAGAQHVVLVPSVVDVSRYSDQRDTNGGVLRLGWIGTPITQTFLAQIGPALSAAARQIPIEVVAIGADGLDIPGVRVVARPWSEDSEAAELKEIDIGLMPLSDSPFARGKCGYKLVQYMAAGLPTIAYPTAANRAIVDQNVTGLLARSDREWEDAILQLARDPALRRRFGAAGRDKVAAQYSTEFALPLIARVLMDAAERRTEGSVMADASPPQ